MTARVDSSSLDDYSSICILRVCSESFKNGDKQSALRDFQVVPTTHQNKVYEHLWINKRRPEGNPEYGRHSFNDTNGLYSTVLEKASAIDGYVQVWQGNQDRLIAGNGHSDGFGGGWVNVWEQTPGVPNGGRIGQRHTFDGNQWGDRIDQIVPRADDPECAAKAIGLAIGVIGTALIVFLSRGR